MPRIERKATCFNQAVNTHTHTCTIHPIPICIIRYHQKIIYSHEEENTNVFAVMFVIFFLTNISWVQGHMSFQDSFLVASRTYIKFLRWVHSEPSISITWMKNGMHFKEVIERELNFNGIPSNCSSWGTTKMNVLLAHKVLKLQYISQKASKTTFHVVFSFTCWPHVVWGDDKKLPKRTLDEKQLLHQF